MSLPDTRLGGPCGRRDAPRFGIMPGSPSHPQNPLMIPHTVTAVPAPATAPAAPQPAVNAVWINGELVPPDKATVSVFDHGLLYGDGVFEGIRMYGGRVLKCKTHLDRLYASAKAVRLAVPYSREQLTRAIRDTCEANGRTDAYIRLCVTRGVGTLGLNPFNCAQPTVFIIAASIQLYPPELYEQGMSVIIARTIRTDPRALSPAIKSMNYLNNILAKTEAIDAGVLEAIMLNSKGHVAECTGDNIFLVKDGKLLRPTLEAGILEGVTMRIVQRLAIDAGIEVIERDLVVDDVMGADEVFLTGSAAEVIPVTRVGSTPIADGNPGPITRQLNTAFRKMIADGAPED